MPRIEIEHMSLAELMSGRPDLIRLFIDLHLRCIGCPIAPFHTLADTAKEHGYAPGDLMAEIAAIVGRPPRHSGA